MKKHELNVGFDWQEREGPYRLISEEQAAQYNRQGFVVFENVFDDATIDALLSELDPLEERVPSSCASISTAKPLSHALTRSRSRPTR